MTIPRIIKHPTLKSATTLTPKELNAIRFSPHRTLLTPDQLEKLKSDPSETDK